MDNIVEMKVQPGIRNGSSELNRLRELISTSQNAIRLLATTIERDDDYHLAIDRFVQPAQSLQVGFTQNCAIGCHHEPQCRLFGQQVEELNQVRNDQRFTAFQMKVAAQGPAIA